LDKNEQNFSDAVLKNEQICNVRETNHDFESDSIQQYFSFQGAKFRIRRNTTSDRGTNYEFESA
jgi:hypothetical protein